MFFLFLLGLNKSILTSSKEHVFWSIHCDNISKCMSFLPNLSEDSSACEVDSSALSNDFREL